MRAVVTVIGKDTVGILHKVSGICAEFNVNVIEVTQSVLQDMFAMIMLVDISAIKGDFSELVDRMEALGIYEVAPEDFALCEFVDASKTPVQQVIADGLVKLRKEME